MKITKVDTEPVKLCHARPGDVIEFLPEEDKAGQYFLVVTDSSAVWGSTGLYGAKKVGLVNLETGIFTTIRSLSMRVVIHRNAELILNSKERT